MIIKKFQGKTEEEALQKAKEAMGNNVVIMNKKTIKKAGILGFFSKPVVEITAALEEVYEAKPAQPKTEIAQNRAERAADIIATFSEKTQGKTKETEALEEKIDTLQSLLMQQLHQEEKEEKEQEKITKEEAEEVSEERLAITKLIYNKMVENEVDEKYVNQIMGEIEKTLKSDCSVDQTLSSIYQKMILKLGQPKSIEWTEGERKVVFFIGPTGVGKTTTIAKIASKFSLEENAKVALVTADTYRIAATEQLRTYANILNIPFRVVYNGEDLTEAMKVFDDYDLILVDTSGHSSKNLEQLDETKKLMNSIKDQEDIMAYLVLSTTTKYRDLLNIVDAYKDIPDYRLIFTKLDETSCLGNILNMKLYTGADLSYVTDGQNVPDDIEQLDPQRIVKQLLGGK